MRHFEDFPRGFPFACAGLAWPTLLLAMTGVLARCFGCFGPISGLDEEVRTLLNDFSLTGCVVKARTTGYRLGESPYGFVDEVSL